MTGAAQRGFTLIELAIVLVIIGLIVGGILVGQSLISAAGVRATITQIEKYNTAANTFREKYGYLPGDLNAASALQFGFASRAGTSGRGDGNGIIQGFDYASSHWYGWNEGSGETGLFWNDLSVSNLIDGSFTAAVDTAQSISIGAATTPDLDNFLPVAKLGRGNYFYVYSTGSYSAGGNGLNYWGLSAVSAIATDGNLTSAPALTVQEAYGIDKKIDDGLPMSGTVQANYLTGFAASPPLLWAAGNGATGASSTAATHGTATTCYDNGNVGGATQQYSVEISNGSNVNCALSFHMQAGD
jgi:prepilin-type N-terminal cleavage/methylation domain-containing protein